MGNYAKAMREGMRAYADKKRQCAEIRSVLDELDGELAGLLSEPIAQAFNEITKRVTLGIGGAHVCTLETPANGYPLTVSYADRRSDCYDRESLVTALCDMLSHPETGGKLKRHLRSVGDSQL